MHKCFVFVCVLGTCVALAALFGPTIVDLIFRG